MSKFKCAACGKTFESQNSQEDMVREAMENGMGADLLKGEVERVCDYCYRKLMEYFNLKVNEKYMGDK